jgi:uncharacterized membrane protein
MKLTTTIIMGLIAGIFYCWSISVTKGLAWLPDKEYILAFQRLNKAILNPFFFICFMGPVVLLPLCLWRHFHPALLLATALYFIGVMAVTMVGNVPLNDMLEAFDVQQEDITAVSNMRRQFEQPWNLLNHFRTICSIAAFICTLISRG